MSAVDVNLTNSPSGQVRSVSHKTVTVTPSSFSSKNLAKDTTGSPVFMFGHELEFFNHSIATLTLSFFGTLD